MDSSVSTLPANFASTGFWLRMFQLGPRRPARAMTGNARNPAALRGRRRRGSAFTAAEKTFCGFRVAAVMMRR